MDCIEKYVGDVSSSGDVSAVPWSGLWCFHLQILTWCYLNGKWDIKGPLKHTKDPIVGIKGTCSAKVRLNWKKYNLCLESFTETCLFLDVGRDTDFKVMLHVCATSEVLSPKGKRQQEPKRWHSPQQRKGFCPREGHALSGRTGPLQSNGATPLSPPGDRLLSGRAGLGCSQGETLPPGHCPPSSKSFQRLKLLFLLRSWWYMPSTNL